MKQEFKVGGCVTCALDKTDCRYFKDKSKIVDIYDALVHGDQRIIQLDINSINDEYERFELKLVE